MSHPLKPVVGLGWWWSDFLTVTSPELSERAAVSNIHGRILADIFNRTSLKCLEFHKCWWQSQRFKMVNFVLGLEQFKRTWRTPFWRRCWASRRGRGCSRWRTSRWCGTGRRWRSSTASTLDKWTWHMMVYGLHNFVVCCKCVFVFYFPADGL